MATWLAAWMTVAALGADRPCTVLVEARYPGANATVIADTVAAPIEQQTAALPHALRRRSKSTDGHYVLAVSLSEKGDPKAALTAVRERLALAEPMLPEETRRRGVTIRLRTPPLAIIALASPGGMYDALFLSNYADLHLKSEWQRIPGVGDVALLGKREYQLRVHLDPDRLRALNLDPGEVVKILQKETAKLGAPPSSAGLDELKKVEAFDALVLQTTVAGQSILLRDVARLELSANEHDSVLSKGRPCVALVIAPTADADPATVNRRISETLSDVRKALPVGMQLDADFAFPAGDSPPAAEFLAIDLQFPDGVSQDRLLHSLMAYESALRRAAGVTNVLAFTANPLDLFSREPCLLVRLSPSIERKISTDEIERQIRVSLTRLPEAHQCLRRLPSDPRCLTFAVSGPEMEKVRMLADQCVQDWRTIDGVTEARIEGSAQTPRIEFEIDRVKAKAMGVSIEDVANTLALVAGPTSVGEIDAPGRRMSLTASLADGFRLQPESIRALTVRNKDGHVVPLATIVAVRQVIAPNSIERIDGKPAVRLTMNVSKTIDRSSVQGFFSRLRPELKLPADHTLIDLQD